MKLHRVRFTVRSLMVAAVVVVFLTTLTPVCMRRETRPAPARSPRIDELSPRGVRRGFTSELTVRGSALSGHPSLVAPFRFTIATPASGGSDDAVFRARIRVDPASPLGIYPVRVLTDEGMSEPFPLAVGQLAVVHEKEDNDDVDKTAQWVTIPTVIEGRLPVKDHDNFRFGGKKGQRIVADLQSARIGSGVDAEFFMVSLDREFTTGVHPAMGDPADTPTFAVLPADGDYLFFVSHAAYRPIKGGPRVYRLTLGALPAAGEVYPLGGRRGETIRVELRGGTLDGMAVVPVTLTPAPGESIVRVRAPTARLGPDGSPLDIEALPPLVVGELPEVREPTAPDAPPPRVTPPLVFNGRIDPPDDEDRVTLAVTPGQRLRVHVASVTLGSALVTRFVVRDARGKERVASAYPAVPTHGDVPEHKTSDPSAEFTVPEGETEMTLGLRGIWTDPPPEDPLRTAPQGGTGHAYRVTIAPVTPGFSVALKDAQVSVPRGGAAAVGVTVSRDGFDGPITLRVADPPAGLTVRPGTIAAGQTVGAFTIAATVDAAFGPVVLDLVGEGRGPDGPVVAHASKVILFGAATTSSFRWRVDAGEDKDGRPWEWWDTVPPYLRSMLLTQPGLFVAPARADPLALDAPAAPVEVAQGSQTTFKIRATRPKGGEGALTLSPLPLPTGLSIPEVTIDAIATEATVRVHTAPEHPLGAVSVVLTARGRIGGAERCFAVPAVTLRIVRRSNGTSD